MKRKNKVFILSGILMFIIVFYFGAGIVASSIVLTMIFETRASNVSDLLENENRIYKLRDDYDNLKSRTEYDIKSKYNLKGYYYKVENSKGLVLAAHGLKSQADGFDAEYQSWFVENGYSVFSIDISGSGRSDGNSAVGLHQSPYDIYAAYQFIVDNNLLEDKLILVGHSWGAFGSLASLSFGVKADYVIAFSAYDNPYDTMLQYSLNYMGPAIYLTIPTFNITTSIKYGSYNNTLSASKSLLESNAKALIIQGKDDKNVPYDGIAVYNKVSETNNITKLLLDGIGHEGPWRSKASVDYVKNEVMPNLNKLTNQEEIDKYINSIDKNKTSELSEIVFNKIEDFLK